MKRPWNEPCAVSLEKAGSEFVFTSSNRQVVFYGVRLPWCLFSRAMRTTKEGIEYGVSVSGGIYKSNQDFFSFFFLLLLLKGWVDCVCVGSVCLVHGADANAITSTRMIRRLGLVWRSSSFGPTAWSHPNAIIGTFTCPSTTTIITIIIITRMRHSPARR